MSDSSLSLRASEDVRAKNEPPGHLLGTSWAPRWTTKSSAYSQVTALPAPKKAPLVFVTYSRGVQL